MQLLPLSRGIVNIKLHSFESSSHIMTRSILLPLLALLVSCEPKSKESSPSAPQDSSLTGIEQTLESAKKAIDPVPEEKPLPLQASPLKSMVLVQSTNQTFNTLQPWVKNAPSFERGFAMYVGDGKFLTTANVVSASNFVELVSPDRSRTVSAAVQIIDEEADLALLSLKNPADSSFSESMVPISIGDAPALNDNLTLWQFNSEGLPIITKGSLQSTDLNAPYTNDSLFTTYDVKSSTAPVIAHAGIPIMSEDKLVGLSLKCNTDKQQVLSLSQPVIKRFLEETASGSPYVGFPEIGIETDYLDDTVFRRYLKLDERGGGIFISKVLPRSAADSAGIRQGDVLESINGAAIDARGLVKDEKLGPVNYSMLLRDTRKQGDSITLDMKRDGKPYQATVTLNRDAIKKDIIPRPPAEQQPDFIIEGGIIFQVMTYPLLESLTQDNTSKASMEMLDAIDKKEDYVKQGRKEIILITNVLPTQAALGYSFLPGSILQTVNGVVVKDLKHLAELFDQTAENDIIPMETNKPPYVIYLSQKAVRQGNNTVRSNGIPVLRHISK